MKVKNLSGRTGHPVANQFIIEDGDVTYFQSYDRIIVKSTGLEVLLDETYWDYSVTTRKFRNKFLGENSEQIKKKIESGQYRLVNLN